MEVGLTSRGHCKPHWDSVGLFFMQVTSVLLNMLFLKTHLETHICEIIREVNDLKSYFEWLTIYVCFFSLLSDAQNAFKVRISIKTALGDNAVSNISSHILHNSISAKIEVMYTIKFVNATQAIYSAVLIVMVFSSHDPGINFFSFD